MTTPRAMDTVSAHLAVDRLQTGVFYYEVRMGNPNGDPDAGNQPRRHSDSDHLLVTDGSIKRKVRDYVQTFHGEEPGREIYVSRGKPLSVINREMVNALRARLGLAPLKPKKSADAADPAKAGGKSKAESKVVTGVDSGDVVRELLARFWDARTFGQLFADKDNDLNQPIRGPVQIEPASSVDEVAVMDVSITRVARHKDDDRDGGEMGRRFVVPYVLFRVHVTVNATAAASVGFTSEDLALFWAALEGGIDHDVSSSRPYQQVRYGVVYTHPGPRGGVKLHKIHAAVSAVRRPGVTVARCYEDYDVQSLDVPGAIRTVLVE